MKVREAKHRVAISTVLALVVTSVFTLSSLAASNINHNPTGEKAVSRVSKLRLDAPAGKLIGTGRITIDGEEVPTGATVLSGSKIATGPDGNATIDLGPLGRIQLSPNTTVTLVFSNNSVQVDMSGGGTVAQWLPSGVDGHMRAGNPQVRFVVIRGQVEVRSARSTRKLFAGEAGTFNDPAEAFASGDATLVAEVGGSRDNPGGAVPRSGGISVGRAGVVTLAGVASSFALGVVAGRNYRSSSTLPKPSTVVP
ncbi:MAG TPA: hypothetical protein VGL29_06910 [Blastocatellia bacterium]|jgi:hypothetical protein